MADSETDSHPQNGISAGAERIIPGALSEVEKKYEAEQKKQDELLQKRFAEMDVIEKSLHEITSTKTDDKPEMVNRVEKLSGMKKHLDGLMSEITDIIKQRQETHFRLMELEEKMLQDQKIIQSKVDNFDEKRMELEDQCKEYEEVLRLKLERPEGMEDSIKVTFKNPSDDEDSSTRPEPWIVLQSKEGVYSVPSLEPNVDGLDNLVDDLNNGTTTLEQFISSVRDKFLSQN